MTAEGASVINTSLAFGFDGPGDGTSPFSDSPLKAVDRAVAAGVAWVTAAGNYNQTTWYSDTTTIYTVRDLNVDFVAFDGADDISNELIGLGGDVSVDLRWDDNWGGASSDLDLLLWDTHPQRIRRSQRRLPDRIARSYSQGIATPFSLFETDRTK